MGRMAAILGALAGLLLAQTEGPLEIKEGPVRKRPSIEQPASSGQESSKVIRIVEVDANGKVIEIRLPEGTTEPGTDNFIEQARLHALTFTEELPNFLCEQLTWRFSSESRIPSWKTRDRVMAEVVYENGKESYRNIRLNGKPLRKGTPESTGSWSTGEFGTVQIDILSPSTNAYFTFIRVSDASGRPARLYEYTVEQPNSHWRVDYGGHIIYPAYGGNIWIDVETGRVLRVEMQARDVPESYPMNVIEMTVDYGFVRISGKTHLLPVKAENLSCQRGTYYCSRNEIEFKNYRKFTAESTISTTDSSISFEGEEKHKPSK
ncbi:MAG: hypothetical protein WD696_09525 [Bryobacteraceae bacterium]